MKGSGTIFVHGAFADGRYRVNAGAIAEALLERLEAGVEIEFFDEAGVRQTATLDPESWKFVGSDDGRIAMLHFDAEFEETSAQVSPLDRTLST